MTWVGPRRFDHSPESICCTTLSRMAMGTRRDRHEQHELWECASDLPTSGAHPFYQRVNALLDEHHFDAFVEGLCQPFYDRTIGRPGSDPGMHFRLLLVDYF